MVFLKKKWLTIAVLFILVLFSPVLFLWVTYGFNSDFLAIDSCLDSGGAWDYEKSSCDGLKE
jgi:hypothetical protein